MRLAVQLTMRYALLLLLTASACDQRALQLPNGPGDGGAADLALAPDLAGLSCGTRGGKACPSGFFCELASACGADDSGGACVAIPNDCKGANAKQPECGCDNVTYANPCARQRASASLAHAGACVNPCEAAGGYCDPGDFVQPICKAGYLEDTQLEQSHPGVCGLGICCVPATPPPGDCRATGCGPGTHCDGCLGANGVEYVCIGNGAAC